MSFFSWGLYKLSWKLSGARTVEITRLYTYVKVKVKVKQSRYRPGVAQRVPGS
jgi:hypothetical protein